MKNQLTLRKRTAIWIGRILTAMTACAGMAMTAFADKKKNDPDAKLEDVTEPIVGLVAQIMNVAIIVVTAVGAVFCISLGVKLAKAEEPQEREKAKQHLKNAIIGFVLIFVLVVALRIGAPLLTDWMNSASPSSAASSN